VSSSKLLLQLMSDKIEAEGKLFVALRLQGPDAPGIAGLHAKLDSDNNQITKLKDELAGDKTVATNMASTVARFETLELQHQFAVRMYGFARDGVERARIASIRQQIYLAVFVPPSLPQDYTYPLRWTDFILISILAAMTWICGVTLTASVLDHRL
jgi:capsular polysaccharide transport system permease protein